MLPVFVTLYGAQLVYQRRDYSFHFSNPNREYLDFSQPYLVKGRPLDNAKKTFYVY